MVDASVADRDGLLERLAIRELLEGYADAVSQGDARDWGDTWSAQDSEWEIGGQTLCGRDEIVRYWRDRMAEFAWVLFRVSVGRIEVTGDEATARSYTAETFGGIDGKRREVLGRYDDMLRRDDGVWRFHRRRFTPLN